MEFLDAKILKLDINTAAIKSGDIQEVLMALKKNAVLREHNPEYQNKILEKLWFHLRNELQEFDNQLLCSITFFTALYKSSNEEFYLQEVLQIVQNELETKVHISKSRISLAISLCYGIFQSSYILAVPEQSTAKLYESIIDTVFQLLIQETYKYTQYTFIVFRILTSLSKICSIPLQEMLMDENNKIKLLNLINHNWENPITGIRNLNRIVFRNLLLFLSSDQYIYKLILNEVNIFYWNKAKYLMLAEIIDQSNENVKDIILNNDWLNGLMYSLSKPGLVSAGADMYNVILKRIDSSNVWIEIFLHKLIQTLASTCNKVVENFGNYWCLNTLKKFPNLSEVLIREIAHLIDSEQKLFTLMSIMKQSNKLGLITIITENSEINYCYESIDINNLIFLSLEHSSVSIRMSAFEIICLHQQKTYPSGVVYKYILKYLADNVNSDCTVLRISMINSLSMFLAKLLTLFLNTTKTNDNENIQKLVTFCESMQYFVIESLALDGNYQRKITSVKIAYAILKCLGEVPRKKREQIRTRNTSLIDFLKEHGHWKINCNNFIMTLLNLIKDPAKDVNEGVLQLLSEYYLEDLSKPLIINLLIEEGLKCIASKFFYEISCGHIIFKLIINIIRKNNIECMFKNIEDIFNFAYNEITLEYTSDRDIVASIEDGKQLHSFMSILSLIFEDSIKKSYKLNIPHGTIYQLLDIVEHVSNQFVWEKDLATCSDFSKMSEMVQTLIKKSGIEPHNEGDNTQISGLYQIVLNSLWLNVKASCELASLLVQCYKYDKNICERSLNIIIHVLETSRHKGAIEAAGAALGVAIQFLTSLADDLEVSKLPLNLLKKKFKELLLETAMSSVTRRGAGLSIMVHRIVSNDLQKGKPLFHYLIKTLLDTCKNLNDINGSEAIKDVDNEKDLPKAIYIHLLTRIVTDSSLASDTMYYSAELAALAFNNLSNNHWQIRNAALQLYGALIPKLIGQKKASGIDEETVATVGYDEFRTHSPKLWMYIVQQIQNKNYQDVIQAHSNLVPTLNVLASLAKRYNFSYDLNKQKRFESNLLQCLISLLGSPIYTVRRLTAQCITNIYTFQIIYEELYKLNNNVTENYLHGSLMLFLNCYKTYGNSEFKKMENLISKYQDLSKHRNASYICLWNLEMLVKVCDVDNFEPIKNILLEVNLNRYKPGASLWANCRIKKCLEIIPWSMFPETLELLLKSQEFDVYCETFINRIKQNSDVPKEDALIETVKVLLSSLNLTKNSEIWKFLFYISLKIDLNPELLNFNQIRPLIKHPSYKSRYIIPFVSRVLVQQKDDEKLLLLSKSILLLCNPEKNDIDMRNIAVLGNNEFGNELQNMSDDVIINVIESALILLQDEDEDIRNLSVKFYENIQKYAKHPFICLNSILCPKFLQKFLKEPKYSIKKIYNDLLNFIDSISINKNNEYNPFSNDSKNIYLEIKYFRETLLNLSKSYT